jgi:flagellar biosynthetic protein FliR
VTINIAPADFMAFLLAFIRATAWLAFAPPFANRAIPSQLKIGLAGGLALYVAPHWAATDGTALAGLDTAGFMGQVVLQVVTGVALGFLLSLLLGAVSSAGSLIDLVGGLGSAQAFDPLSDIVSTITSRFYDLIATTLLFATGGYLLVIRGFLTSFQVNALSGQGLSSMSSVLTHDLGLFFAATVEIAAPILGVMFLTDMALGLLTRAAPQLNVMQLGFSIKLMLTFLVVGAALPLLPGTVSSLVDHALRDGLGLLGLGG